MANKSFVAVNWTPSQVIDEDSLDQMNNNIIVLRNQKVEGKYQHQNGGIVDTGVKILCGRGQITPRAADTATIRIGFANMFTPDSQPIISTSIVSPGHAKFFHVINGINGLHPNHQGFDCKVVVYADSKKNSKFTDSIFIHWVAMGF